jgi:3-hydroxy-9,10-secoandrosta-1,3,5(10)-triene-9,17-dione monooxygenase
MTVNCWTPTNVDAELVARASALSPLLAGNAVASEQARQVVDANIEALEVNGLFDVMTPTRVGGAGATMATQLAVAAQLGAVCTSTAWVQTLLNVATWATSRASVQAQQEIFADATVPARVFGVLAPTGTAVPVDGGYRVNGTWGFASGGFHGTWAGGGVLVLDERGEVVGVGMATMRASEVSFLDTWHVAGMQGTNSNTIVAEDVYVPRHRVNLDLGERAGGDYPTEPSDAWPMGTVLALVLVGPLLGAARGALELVAGKAAGKPISYTSYATAISSPVAVADIARAALDIDMAWMYAFDAATYVDGVGAGATRDLGAEARYRGAFGHATDRLRGAVDTLLNVAGAGAFANSNPLQRMWRDLNVASRHAFLATNPSLETFGRSIFGLDPIYVIV